MRQPETAYVKPIRCVHCGASAQLIRRLPDIARRSGEIRTFACVVCNKETELVTD